MTKYHLKQAFQLKNGQAYPAGIYEEGALPKEAFTLDIVYQIGEPEAKVVVEKAKKSDSVETAEKNEQIKKDK